MTIKEANELKRNWIKVNDALPDRSSGSSNDSIDCIICFEEEGSFNPCKTATAWYNYSNKCWQILHFYAPSGKIEVTHWMPLILPK